AKRADDGALRDREIVFGEVLHQPKAVGRRAIEGILRVGVVERVRRIVPAAAQDIALGPGLVEAPFPRVAGHIVSPEAADAVELTHRGWSFSTQVALRNDRRAAPGERSSAPVIDGRQLGPGEPRIGGGFVPAHSGDGIVSLPFRIATALPRCRARPPRLVHEPRHRLGPRQLATAAGEWLLPEILLLIAAGVHEALGLFF